MNRLRGEPLTWRNRRVWGRLFGVERFGFSFLDAALEMTGTEAMVLGLPVAFWLLGAIAAAAALIYLPFLAVGYARAKLGYDQSAPRAMFDQLPPYAQRATWAHENAIETFPIFAAAAVMSYVTGVESAVAAWAAIAFVIARTFYPIAYIANVPVLRSLCFATGSTAVIILFAHSLSRVLA